MPPQSEKYPRYHSKDLYYKNPEQYIRGIVGVVTENASLENHHDIDSFTNGLVRGFRQRKYMDIKTVITVLRTVQKELTESAAPGQPDWREKPLSEVITILSKNLPLRHG